MLEKVPQLTRNVSKNDSLPELKWRAGVHAERIRQRGRPTAAYLPTNANDPQSPGTDNRATVRRRLPGSRDRKHLNCPHITIRKSPSGLLSGSNVRTARSKVASFPFLWIASPNK